MAATPLLDVRTVAARLGTTERHIRQLIADRRIPFFKVGRSVRFDPDIIDRWLADNEREAVS